MRTYNVIDGYFSKYIHKYFENKPDWEYKKSSNVDLFHTVSLKLKSNDCTIYNQLVDINPLGNKRLLFQNIEKLYTHSPKYLPYSIYFNVDSFNKLEITKELSQFKFWILKPENSLRQKGISIVQNINDIEVALKKNPNFKEWILQQYIDKPLLYNEKKTHFRVYMYITIKDDIITGYLYNKGYLYVADYKYKLDDFRSEIQITTSCNNQEYPKILSKIFKKNTYNKIFYPQLKHIAQDIIKATYKELQCSTSFCYKFISLDVISDIYKKLYLLEVNARIVGIPEEDTTNSCLSKNPSLHTPKFKNKLIHDLYDTILYNKKTDLHKIIEINKSSNKINLFSNKLNIKKKCNKCNFCKIKYCIILAIILYIVLVKSN